MSKDLTDAELVEAVAREVLQWQVIGWNGPLACRDMAGNKVTFDPFYDLNDLFMVLDGDDSYMILKDGETGCYTVTVMMERKNAVATTNTLHRAILEAALMAERSEK